MAIQSGDDILPENFRGMIFAYAGSSAPTGFLICDGSAVSRTTYSGLFNLIGTSYGTGDGSTTFNVPDLRGRFPLGKDDMGGSSANNVTDSAADSLGGTGGEEEHTLTVSEIPSHTHGLDMESGNQGTGSGGNVVEGTGKSTNNTGGDSAHENMPPYQTVNYIIKT